MSASTVAESTINVWEDTIDSDDETIQSDGETDESDSDDGQSLAYDGKIEQISLECRDSFRDDDTLSADANDGAESPYPKVYFKTLKCLCDLDLARCHCRFGYLLGAGLLRNTPKDTDTEVWALTRACGCNRKPRPCACPVSELVKDGVLRCKPYQMAKSIRQQTCTADEQGKNETWPAPLKTDAGIWLPKYLKEDMVMDFFRAMFMRSSA
jgi:hypothetical protein